jgi:alpha-1,3-rhamnosyl/mannosyltransferase
MGTLGLRKNVGTLLEAYARLRARVANAPPLTLAGHTTPASARWEARAGEPPLAGHVEITGYVNEARRIELFADACMLVLPSYEEGFGLPVLEAMACGVPVVISSRGSLPEVAGPAANPVEPDDADGLMSRMQALLNPDTAREASRKGREQAAHYSWRACAAAARGAYRAAREAHAGRR